MLDFVVKGLENVILTASLKHFFLLCSLNDSWSVFREFYFISTFSDHITLHPLNNTNTNKKHDTHFSNICTHTF
jgi:hypothetical protein